jgi:hypothetical protein
MRPTGGSSTSFDVNLEADPTSFLGKRRPTCFARRAGTKKRRPVSSVTFCIIRYLAPHSNRLQDSAPAAFVRVRCSVHQGRGLSRASVLGGQRILHSRGDPKGLRNRLLPVLRMVRCQGRIGAAGESGDGRSLLGRLAWSKASGLRCRSRGCWSVSTLSSPRAAEAKQIAWPHSRLRGGAWPTLDVQIGPASMIAFVLR